MIIRLKTSNQREPLFCILQNWQESLESKLALVEIHTYNPAHRK
jgi:hypothetical protein